MLLPYGESFWIPSRVFPRLIVFAIYLACCSLSFPAFKYAVRADSCWVLAATADCAPADVSGVVSIVSVGAAVAVAVGAGALFTRVALTAFGSRIELTGTLRINWIRLFNEFWACPSESSEIISISLLTFNGTVSLITPSKSWAVSAVYQYGERRIRSPYFICCSGRDRCPHKSDHQYPFFSPSLNST